MPSAQAPTRMPLLTGVLTARNPSRRIAVKNCLTLSTVNLD